MVCAGGVKGEDSCQVRTKMVSQVLHIDGECTTLFVNDGGFLK